MSQEVYYHFPQTDGQARRCGARGGEATARNRRARQDGAAAEAPQTQTAGARQFPRESTAAAIALLDRQYPWLRGAEKRFLNRSPGAVTETLP